MLFSKSLLCLSTLAGFALGALNGGEKADGDLQVTYWKPEFHWKMPDPKDSTKEKTGGIVTFHTMGTMLELTEDASTISDADLVAIAKKGFVEMARSFGTKEKLKGDNRPNTMGLLAAGKELWLMGSVKGGKPDPKQSFSYGYTTHKGAESNLRKCLDECSNANGAGLHGSFGSCAECAAVYVYEKNKGQGAIATVHPQARIVAVEDKEGNKRTQYEATFTGDTVKIQDPCQHDGKVGCAMLVPQAGAKALSSSTVHEADYNDYEAAWNRVKAKVSMVNPQMTKLETLKRRAIEFEV